MRDAPEVITKINSQLYLGGSHYMTSNKNTLLDQLEKLGINSIINVASNIDYTTTIRYRKFAWDDCDIPLFKFYKTDDTVEPGDSQLTQSTRSSDYPTESSSYPTIIEVEKYLNYEIGKGRVVYVHCQMGISRSASLVIFHYIKRYDMSFYQAYSCIRDLRGCIRPNDYFMSQLMQYLERRRRQLRATNKRAACKRAVDLAKTTTVVAATVDSRSGDDSSPNSGN